MRLVRMLQDGQPKYIRSDGVTEITWEDGPANGCTGVTYEGGRPPVVVDGSPDEVFKALFNPPEMIEKAPVEKIISEWWAHADEAPGLSPSEVNLIRSVLESLSARIGVRYRR